MVNDKYFLSMYEKAVPDELSLKEKLQYCKDFGFDGLEISIDASDWRLARLDWSKEERKSLKRDIEEVGLPIYSMCLSGHRKYPMGSLDPQVQKRAMEIMKKAIDFACDLGIRIIQLAGYDEFDNPSTQETAKNFEKNLKVAVEMASKKGVFMGFETMDTEFMNTTEKAMKYVNIINSPYLNVYPDIGNLKNAAVMYGTNVDEDIKIGAHKIIAAHLKETIPGHDRDIPFGTGHTEYLSNIKTLKELGVRYFNGEFWCKGDNWIEDGKFACKFLRERLDKVFDEQR